MWRHSLGQRLSDVWLSWGRAYSIHHQSREVQCPITYSVQCTANSPSANIPCPQDHLSVLTQKYCCETHLRFRHRTGTCKSFYKVPNYFSLLDIRQLFINYIIRVGVTFQYNLIRERLAPPYQVLLQILLNSQISSR